VRSPPPPPLLPRPLPSEEAVAGADAVEGDTPAQLATSIRVEARRLGFDSVGIASAAEPLGIAFERYEKAIDDGYFEDLPYVLENRGARAGLAHEGILPGARSVICVARRYHRAEAAPAGVVPLIARYARGRDYHNGLRKKLRKLAVFLRGLAPGVEARPMIDDAPILERAWAARAGLGFVGKNGLLIVPGQGSFVLLGEVVTTLALPPDEPMTERCGSCTRCLDACPTQAFPQPFVLDPRKCIATLTIERRTPAPVGLRAGMGEHLFGCDDCQTVCPFNGTRPPPPEQTSMFAPLDRWSQLTLEELLRWSPADFARETEGSPLFRATFPGLLRNAIVVAVNQRRAQALPALEELTSHADDSVRELAVWGKLRLSNAPES
jgi:epoxyqueuosine reductase